MGNSDNNSSAIESAVRKSATVGMYLTAFCVAMLVVTETIALFGALFIALFDVDRFGLTAWLVVSAVFVPPSAWLIVTLFKLAIEGETLVQTANG